MKWCNCFQIMTKKKMIVKIVKSLITSWRSNKGKLYFGYDNGDKIEELEVIKYVLSG